ncbi:MAG: VWA domain-containing protein [Gammaproteobacteria bacterium]|jgi:Ca-activated chloride channel family protein
MDRFTLYLNTHSSLRRLLLLLTASAFTLLACSTPTEQPTANSQAAPKKPHQDPAGIEQEPAAPKHSADKLEEINVLARRRAERLQETPLAAAADISQGSADMAIALHGGPVGRYAIEPVNRENYAHYSNNPVKRVSENPVSTFSIDVDTGAYSNVRRMLNDGYLPPQDAVRIEELINYFGYDYTPPRDSSAPFSINTEIAVTPWNPTTHLLRIGLKGYEMPREERPAANLVFLVDVSGSMQSPDKLPLLKSAFRLLTAQLGQQDSVALVVYAGGTGIVLEPTPGDRKATIMSAVDQLSAGGSTNGAAGIRLAYQMAEQAYIADGINRVVLATDGDFNVGTVNFESLIDLVEERRTGGISLTTLGFGTGNYNDHLMEQLADKGNGNYAYIDSLNEARKVLVEELSATLHTIASDVKIQVEFNPAVVAEYRLIGYENRSLRREDFNNDKIDAGEIGAGHSVTALYEISLAESAGLRIDPLRYGSKADTSGQKDDELAFVRLRYKQKANSASRLIEQALITDDIVDLTRASTELRFAAAVAAFGQQLRGGEYLESFGYKEIRELADAGRGNDPFGYRGEFVGLVALAESLSTSQPDRVAVR